MTSEENRVYHTEAELVDRNAKIASELEKLGLEKQDTESNLEDEADLKYDLIQLESRAGHVYQLYTVADIYPTVLAFDYSIARQVGLGLDNETIDELLEELPADFPIDVEESPTEAAGLMALSNMSPPELEELNYRIINKVNADRLDFETQVYDGVIHSVRIMGALFPAEESHTIQHTEEIQITIQTTGIGVNQFIRYAFSGLDGKDTEDITSEGPLF